MTEQLYSITIRPTQEEFDQPIFEVACNYFCCWMNDEPYIVSIEKGKGKKDNHYQIALISKKHPSTIRRAINRFFAKVLTPSTLRKGVWRKCIKHNNLHSLLGYVQKEGQLFKTNIEASKLKAELELYNSQIRKKPEKKAIEWPKCRRHPEEKLLINIPNYILSNDHNRNKGFYNYFCKKCNKPCFPIF